MNEDARVTDVVVIGAGQAGLSSAYFLRRAGFEPGTGYVVLDGDRAPGGAWQHRWPSLRMETVNGIFDLPGMAFEPPSPQEQASVAVPRYFAEFEEHFQLAVHRPATVRAVRYGPGDRLLVETRYRDVGGARRDQRHGDVEPSRSGRTTRAVKRSADVSCTPPAYPGPEEFAGKRVVVVGGGITAIQLLTELADAGASTTWVTRRPPVFRDAAVHPGVRTRSGRHGGREGARRARAAERGRRHRPAGHRPDPRGAARRRAQTGCRCSTGSRRTAWCGTLPEAGAPRSVEADVILWCTGWRAALDHLAPLRLRAPGGGITMDGTRVVLEPRLHLVGYGPSASTVGANRAGREAVRDIRRLLSAQGSASLAA